MRRFIGCLIFVFIMSFCFEGRGDEPRGDDTRTMYWAGELFSAHQLLGNVQLRDDLLTASKGRFTSVLPQSLTPDGSPTAINIRNADIQALVRADALILNFEGEALDAGTVVEFMIAKHLGMPTVIVRADSRRSGNGLDDPFNLMLKGWPRSRLVQVNGIVEYKTLYDAEILRLGGEKVVTSEQRHLAELSAAKKLSLSISEKVRDALVEVLAEKCPYDVETSRTLYRSIPAFAGGGLSFPEGFVEKLIEEKRSRSSL